MSSSKFFRVQHGLRIDPKKSGDASTADIKGAADVTHDGKLNYHNGTSASPVVTEDHAATKVANKTLPAGVLVGTTDSQTLSNKTLTNPVVSDTLTTPTNTDLIVNPNGTGKIVASKEVTTPTDTNLTLNPNGTGKIVVSKTITTPTDTDLTLDPNGDGKLVVTTEVITPTDSHLILTPQGTGTVILKGATVNEPLFLAEQGVPFTGPTVASSKGAIYAGSDGNIFYKNDTGSVFDLNSNAFQVVQTAHGLSAMDAIYHDGSDWVKAQANNPISLAQYVVLRVPSVDAFIAAKFGRHYIPSHGKTVGEYYFLSDTVAGGSTTSAPATGYNAPLFYVEDADHIHVMVHRPLSSEALTAAGAPTWVKYSFDYTDFSVGSTSNTITLTSMAQGTFVKSTVIRHSQAFTGGSISAYTVSVGVVGETNKYASAFDVFSAAGDDNYQISEVVDVPSFISGPTTIQIAATSTGANLNAATGGTLEVWLLVSSLPN